MKHRRSLPFGAELDAEGGARFRLWAPAAQRVTLVARAAGDGELRADLNAVGQGWYELSVGGLSPSLAYSYRIDDEIDVPDPASRWNPRGVAGGCALVDPGAFEWGDGHWRGRPWSEAVIYEMHVGCFTREGTYDAAIARLDELAELGVTALELMPLATFAGARGWGYDGVLPFAPHFAYGTPHDLKRFIDAAHARNLMVLLDVVYNHFGPEGNYLPRYAPQFFTAQHRTPWGDAIDFQHPVVRRYFIENALYWLEEYRFDGLRIDAVHAMCDDSPRGFIEELIDEVQAGPGKERHVHVVLENERNEARRLTKGAAGALRAAQWNDDFHHAVHVLLTGESDGYYVDYAERPLECLGRVLTQGFAYQGERSTYSGELRGEPSGHLPPLAFVDFLQNHDQVGNRALGERLAQLTDGERLKAAASVLLLAPHVPLLFMGDEYAAPQPFLYFCDYEGELAVAVCEGRRAEFGRFSAFAGESARAQIPDPNAPTTFERSRLDWEARAHEPHASMLAHTRSLLRARERHVAPRIASVIPGASTFELRESLLLVRWPLREGGALCLAANLGDGEIDFASDDQVLYATADARSDGRLPPWQVRLLLQP